MRVSPQISIVLVYSSDFLIQTCRKLPFVVPTAGVKQGAKAHGPRVAVYKRNHGNAATPEMYTHPWALQLYGAVLSASCFPLHNKWGTLCDVFVQYMP